eukprot:118336-Amphidinium_carterae.1
MLSRPSNRKPDQGRCYGWMHVHAAVAFGCTCGPPVQIQVSIRPQTSRVHALAELTWSRMRTHAIYSARPRGNRPCNKKAHAQTKPSPRQPTEKLTKLIETQSIRLGISTPQSNREQSHSAIRTKMTYEQTYRENQCVATTAGVHLSDLQLPSFTPQSHAQNFPTRSTKKADLYKTT